MENSDGSVRPIFGLDFSGARCKCLACIEISLFGWMMTPSSMKLYYLNIPSSDCWCLYEFQSRMESIGRRRLIFDNFIPMALKSDFSDPLAWDALPLLLRLIPLNGISSAVVVFLFIGIECRLWKMEWCVCLKFHYLPINDVSANESIAIEW